MNAIAVLLPVVAYGLFMRVFASGGSPRELLGAFVKSHVVIFAYVAVSTEVLSAFDALAYPAVLGSWTAFCLAAGAAAFLAARRCRRLPSAGLKTMSPLSVFSVAATGVILSAVLVTAFVYPPNTWDSMTYHMARVSNWMAHRNVEFYATNIDRQNYHLPLAEFAIMHLQILSGGDCFANLVQYSCFLAAICLGALVAIELGLDGAGALTSSVMVATIPMAVLQGSSTQNDIIVACFTMSFALFMLRLRREFAPRNAAFAAASLGLALLSKGTACLYTAALGVCLAVPILLSGASLSRAAKRAGGLATVVLLALSLNFGHCARLYRFYGVHSPSSAASALFCNHISSSAAIGNIPRNMLLHLGTTDDRLNNCILQGVRRIVGTELNNPDATLPGTKVSAVYYSRHEDIAGNPLHMALSVFAIFSVRRLWRGKQHSYARWYCVAVLLAGALYCVCLRWQPWGSRLQTPLFVLCAPVIAVMLAGQGGWSRKCVAWIATIAVVLASLPFALDNQTRSLLSLEWMTRENRCELYFPARPEAYESYRRAIDVVKRAGVRDVGLCLGGDDWEYPFWALAGAEAGRSGIRFHHVGVKGPSERLGTEPVLPEYVIATRSLATWEAGRDYAIVDGDNGIHVWRRQMRETRRPNMNRVLRSAESRSHQS